MSFADTARDEYERAGLDQEIKTLRAQISSAREELVEMTDLLNEAMWRMFDGDMREKVRAKVIELRERGFSK